MPGTPRVNRGGRHELNILYFSAFVKLDRPEYRCRFNIAAF